MAKIYSNVELMATPTKDSHLVNLGFVKGLISERLMDGVKAVIIEDINATYDPVAMTLTQNAGTAINSDGVTLEVNDEILYIGGTDKTQLGRYVITVAPTVAEESKVVTSLGATNTGIITLSDITVDKAVFERGIGTLTSGTYSFVYSDATTSWTYNGADVDIATTYGITIATETPANADTIDIVYTPEVLGVPAGLTSSESYNASEKIKSGQLIPVHIGDLYGEKIMILTTNNPITLDTTPLNYEIYKGVEAGAKVYEKVFTGDDTTPVTEVTITHALATKKLSINIYDEDGGKVYFATKIVDENVVQINSDVELLSDDKFRVVIIAE